MKNIAFFILSLFSLCVADLAQRYAFLHQPPTTNKEGFLDFLSTEELKILSLGHPKILSHILWFRLVDKIGQDIQENKKPKFLYERCRTVTELNPHDVNKFIFCASLLAWTVKNTTNANSLLIAAQRHHPNNWEIFYYRGFNEWYFNNDLPKARKILQKASQIKESPKFIKTIIGRITTKIQGPQAAIDFLRSTIEMAKSDQEKKVLKDSLKLAIVSRDIQILKDTCSSFYEKTSKPPSQIEELANHWPQKQIPLKDPYGERYTFSKDSKCEFTSNRGKTGLEFHGKTAKTGISKHEFINE